VIKQSRRGGAQARPAREGGSIYDA
jgi:hypothetical protein